MEKVGYAFLVSMYLMSFTVGKGLSQKVDAPLAESISYEKILEKVASNIADAIGFNDFFDSLNKGL